MKKIRQLPLRISLIFLICIIILPVNILVIAVSSLALQNAQNRLEDVYRSDLRDFTQDIESIVSKLETEADIFFKKYNGELLSDVPVNWLQAVAMTDELRNIWSRTDLLAGAYFKNINTDQCYITHDNRAIDYSQITELKALLEDKAFNADRSMLKTIQVMAGNYYWMWSYYYGGSVIGFFAPLDAVAKSFDLPNGGCIYLTGPDQTVMAGAPAEGASQNTDMKDSRVFSEAVETLDCEVYLFIPKQLISEGIPMTWRMVQILCIFTVILIPLLWLGIRYFVLDTFSKMGEAMKEIEQNHMDYRLDDTKARSREAAYMERAFNGMVQQIQDLRIEKYEIELKKREIEVVNLKLQMNPHLLLNSLSMVVSLAKTKNFAMIQKFSKHLAAYFRYTLRNPNAMVTVAEELAFVKSYLEIQKIRHPGTFICVYDIKPEMEALRIPSLIIENFVENCIKHALKMESEIEIIIVGHLEGTHMVLSIVDNGNGIEPEVLEKIRAGEIVTNNTGNHIGIWNVRRRLEMLYGTSMQLTINSQIGSGTQVWLRLPVTDREDFE